MSTITEYLESLHGYSIAVIGMGVSNTPLIRMFLRAGLKVTVCDKAPRERVEEQAAELESLGAKLHLGPGYLDRLARFDLIFRTPGLSPNTPELREAAERGSIVTSEMELFFQMCPCKIIGVTGSDGKTTTTTLISEFLKEAGYNVYVGGNIGKPLLPDVAGMTPEDMVVVELSSFQLMSMGQSPNVAVFTNLSPNHLDYHHTMEEYTAAKINIFRYQEPGDRAIFNYDNDITRALSKQAPTAVMLFSRKQSLEEGVYLRDGAIWLTNEIGSREVLPLADDKGVPFTQLGVEIIKKVKTLILTGDTAPAIRKAVEEAEGYRDSGLKLIETEDLSAAVAAAQGAAVAGDVVVLSPACAAFDRFKNFMERGRIFKELVNAL